MEDKPRRVIGYQKKGEDVVTYIILSNGKFVDLHTGESVIEQELKDTNLYEPVYSAWKELGESDY